MNRSVLFLFYQSYLGLWYTQKYGFETRRLQGMRRKKSFLIVGILLLFLAACSGQSIEEKIHAHLEEAVNLEKEFKEQQSEITDLERREQEIYDEIINLGMEDFAEIEELSQEALAIIDERREKIEIERESIMNAKEEFQSIESLLENIKEDQVRSIGEEMYQIMMERYDTYDEIYKTYDLSLDLETELYNLFQDEGIEQEELNEHIESINETYEQVLDANNLFNELTKQYNNLKEEFYKKANIKVKFEEEV